MFRNGGSEYQINGDTCRLLDIQELLSDSGIGREMHVIVGQGQLDSVLHADPMGRRAFIEEAAGVLKHRKRKEKALRKLDAMQANLARVQDLTDELRRQLKPLGRQAAVARRAAVIQADLRDARLRLLADDLVTLREALQTEIADEAALKQRKEAAEGGAEEGPPARGPPGGRGTSPHPAAAQRPADLVRALPARRTGARHRLARRRAREERRPPHPEERRGRDPEDMEREAARIREQEAELEAALEAAERALEDTVAHRAELERELAQEERRLKDVARAIADRREGLARLKGQVGAARSPPPRPRPRSNASPPPATRRRRAPWPPRRSTRPSRRRSTASTPATRNSPSGTRRPSAGSPRPRPPSPPPANRSPPWRGNAPRPRHATRPWRSACAARTAPARSWRRRTASPGCSARPRNC